MNRTDTTGSTSSLMPTGQRLANPQSVPEQTVAAKVRTDTEDRLWEALHAGPNSTAADLPTAAKVGKSTAQKALVKWATDGSVTRTAGIAEGGRRAADLWAITEVNTTQAADPSPADTREAEDANMANTTQAEPMAPDAPDAHDSATIEGYPVEQTDTAADGARDPADPDEADPMEAEPVAAEVSDPTAAIGVDSATTDGDTTDDCVDATGTKKARLAPGELRGMVEDYLRNHPGEQFGPTAIAKALGGKSSGAVSNALDKLVDVGVAAKVQDTPRRFALAPEEQESALTPTI